jgi:protein ImuA
MLDRADSPPVPDLAALRAALRAGAAAEGASPLAVAGAAAEGASPLAVAGPLALARGRLHEAAGPARRVLAARIAGAAQAEGPVIWLRPGWGRERLCPQGLLPLADPGALILAACPRAEDIPWAAEEALRSGTVALVVAELAAAPDLRQVRRLHLAAAEGGARARAAGLGLAPLGLALMAEAVEGGIAGVESRWRLAPLPPEGGAAGPAWRLDRLRGRDAPPAAWHVAGGGGDWRVQAMAGERAFEGP